MANFCNIFRESDQFTVELDSNTTDLTVNKSDLCLTEVMAGIVKEKYPPLSRATPGPKAEIDFGNSLFFYNIIFNTSSYAE